MSGFRNLISTGEEIAHRGMRNVFGHDTHKLADIRAGKAWKYIMVVFSEVQRLAAARGDGLVMATLSSELDQLHQDYTTAAQLVLAAQKNKAMEPVKIQAERLAAAAPTRVSDFLKNWGIVREQRTKAEFLINLKTREEKRKASPPPGVPDLTYVIQPAEGIETAITQLDAAKIIDCEAALLSWMTAYDRASVVLDKYRDEQLKEPLAQQAQDAADLNPKGPEARMQTLYSDLSEKMANMMLTAQANGRGMSGLNPAVAAAIAIYTSGAYSDINETLLGIPGKRSKELETKCREVAEIMATAMTKLAVWEEWPTARGEKPWKGSKEQYKQGNMFTVKSFWSTGVGFKFDGSLQISIFGKKGSKAKDVSGFSRFPTENEVLFPPGTKFKVKSSTTQGDVTTIVVLEV